MAYRYPFLPNPYGYPYSYPYGYGYMGAYAPYMLANDYKLYGILNEYDQLNDVTARNNADYVKYMAEDSVSKPRDIDDSDDKKERRWHGYGDYNWNNGNGYYPNNWSPYWHHRWRPNWSPHWRRRYRDMHGVHDMSGHYLHLSDMSGVHLYARDMSGHYLHVRDISHSCALARGECCHCKCAVCCHCKCAVCCHCKCAEDSDSDSDSAEDSDSDSDSDEDTEYLMFYCHAIPTPHKYHDICSTNKPTHVLSCALPTLTPNPKTKTKPQSFVPFDMPNPNSNNMVFRALPIPTPTPPPTNYPFPIIPPAPPAVKRGTKHSIQKTLPHVVTKTVIYHTKPL
jgi:hypothetical protein